MLPTLRVGTLFFAHHDEVLQLFFGGLLGITPPSLPTRRLPSPPTSSSISTKMSSSASVVVDLQAILKQVTDYASLAEVFRRVAKWGFSVKDEFVEATPFKELKGDDAGARDLVDALCEACTDDSWCHPRALSMLTTLLGDIKKAKEFASKKEKKKKKKLVKLAESESESEEVELALVPYEVLSKIVRTFVHTTMTNMPSATAKAIEAFIKVVCPSSDLLMKQYLEQVGTVMDLLVSKPSIVAFLVTMKAGKSDFFSILGEAKTRTIVDYMVYNVFRGHDGFESASEVLANTPPDVLHASIIAHARKGEAEADPVEQMVGAVFENYDKTKSNRHGAGSLSLLRSLVRAEGTVRPFAESVRPNVVSFLQARVVKTESERKDLEKLAKLVSHRAPEVLAALEASPKKKSDNPKKRNRNV